MFSRLLNTVDIYKCTYIFSKRLEKKYLYIQCIGVLTLLVDFKIKFICVGVLTCLVDF